MPHEEIDGVLSWYQEHGDPGGPPLVALHGGIVTFEGTFGDVLPWLTQGRRVIGVELQGHGHTPDTGRPMSKSASRTTSPSSWTVSSAAVASLAPSGQERSVGTVADPLVVSGRRGPGHCPVSHVTRPAFGRLSGCKPAIRGG